MSKRTSRELLAEAAEAELSTPKMAARGLPTNRRLDLGSLRTALGKTQMEVARRAVMDQADVSKLESRNDMRVSTLARYAGALGGKLEVAVVVGARSYVLDL